MKGLPETLPNTPSRQCVKYKQDISTVQFDDVSEIAKVDLLKIDVQDAELAVLKGGRKKLSEAVAVHSEVSGCIPLTKR